MNRPFGYLLIVASLGATAARAQEKTEPPPPEKGWKHSLVSGLSLTQVSYKNWSKGGENSLAYTLSLDGKSTLTDDMVLWENQYRLAYGQARLGDKSLRKTDDVIDLASVFTYMVAEKVNPYASATFKSQFTTGYKYDDDDVETPVSKFFDPAYFTQAIGVRYQPVAEVRTRLGAGLREVITDEYSSFNYADDPKTPGTIEKTSVHGGIESVTDIEWVVMGSASARTIAAERASAPRRTRDSSSGFRFRVISFMAVSPQECPPVSAGEAIFVNEYGVGPTQGRDCP